MRRCPPLPISFYILVCGMVIPENDIGGTNADLLYNGIRFFFILIHVPRRDALAGREARTEFFPSAGFGRVDAEENACIPPQGDTPEAHSRR